LESKNPAAIENDKSGQIAQDLLMPTALPYVHVFCHGIWADGGCFNKVIPALEADGYDVMAAQ